MAIDLKLIELIKTKQARYSRAQIVEILKKEGHAEQDVSDSYGELVKRSGSPTAFLGGGVKSMAATIVLSIFIPGAGHMYTGAVGKGVLILVLYVFGFFLTITVIGAIVGIPLMASMWLWGLVGSILRCEKINKGLL